jgi:hypothetical protein
MGPPSRCTHLDILQGCLELVQFNEELNQGGPTLAELKCRLEQAADARCPKCAFESQMQFVTEVNVHLPNPYSEQVGIFLFPRLSVCPNCGSAQFKVPSEDLRRLVQQAKPLPSRPKHRTSKKA